MIGQSGFRGRAEVRSRESLPFDDLRGEFLREDPGHPLGAGVPMGETLRGDGQTHYEAWQAVLRTDVCMFCGRKGGSVDHIEPKSRPKAKLKILGIGRRRKLGGVHSWLNLSGACLRCNSKKADETLLMFMLSRRGINVKPKKPKPVKASPVVHFPYGQTPIHGHDPKTLSPH